MASQIISQAPDVLLSAKSTAVWLDSMGVAADAFRHLTQSTKRKSSFPECVFFGMKADSQLSHLSIEQRNV